jgi:polyferredoxin/Flp pilus assembly protein TadD
MKSGCTGENSSKKRSIPLPVLKNSKEKKNEIRESRAGFWRAIVLISLNLLMVAHFVQWQLSGHTVSPIEPSETMYTLQQGFINAGMIFFSLAILATLILGRFVCGWGCHIVALQDFCSWLLKKMGLTPRPFRSRLLIYVPLAAALYMFVWPTVFRFFAKPAAEPLFPQFTNHLITTDFWGTFPPLWIAVPFFFICGFMTVYFLGSKGFCTYACPYGGFFAVADKFAPGKIRVTDACNECGHCTATCTSNVLVHAEVKQYGMVVDPGCMKCMDCISVCPNDALYFGFGKPAITVPKTIKRNFSLTWPEEVLAIIVFIASYLAVWDAYLIVPMLMALGIATITTYLVLRVIKLFRASDLSLYRFNLKSAGTIHRAGWIFLAVAVLWIGFNAHSGWIHYHESAGSQAFDKIRLPDELALAQADPAQWLTPEDRAAIDETREHLRAASNYGLFTNAATLPKLAWVEYLSGNAEQSVQILTNVAEHQNEQAKALSLYYRGAMLNRLGRYDEALKSLDQALTERGDLILATEEKGISLWQLGRKQDAIVTWNSAARRNPGLVLTNNMLSAAASQAGKPETATAFETQGDDHTPEDPYFHWMLGLRLQEVGMNALAEKHFTEAIELDPSFRTRPRKQN